MSVKHIEYLKVKDSKLLVVEVRPVKCLLDTPSGPTYTDKWMQHSHWKALHHLLTDIADEYEEQKANHQVKCNQPKCKTVGTLQIGYMFQELPSCWCSLHFLTPRGDCTWTESDDCDSEKLQDKGGRFEDLVACGDMLIISVILCDLGENCTEPVLSQTPSTSHQQACVNKKLIKALDSRMEYTNSISGYFNTSSASGKDSSSKSVSSSSEGSKTSSSVRVKTTEFNYKKKDNCSTVEQDVDGYNWCANIDPSTHLHSTVENPKPQREGTVMDESGCDFNGAQLIHNYTSEDKQSIMNLNSLRELNNSTRVTVKKENSRELLGPEIQSINPCLSRMKSLTVKEEVNADENLENNSETLETKIDGEIMKEFMKTSHKTLSYGVSYEIDGNCCFTQVKQEDISDSESHHSDSCVSQSLCEDLLNVGMIGIQQENVNVDCETEGASWLVSGSVYDSCEQNISQHGLHNVSLSEKVQDDDIGGNPRVSVGCISPETSLFVTHSPWEEWFTESVDTDIEMEVGKGESPHRTDRENALQRDTRKRNIRMVRGDSSSSECTSPMVECSSESVDRPFMLENGKKEPQEYLSAVSNHVEFSCVTTDHNIDQYPLSTPNCANVPHNELKEQSSQAKKDKRYSTRKKRSKEMHSLRKTLKSNEYSQQITQPILDTEHWENLVASDMECKNSIGLRMKHDNVKKKVTERKYISKRKPLQVQKLEWELDSFSTPVKEESPPPPPPPPAETSQEDNSLESLDVSVVSCRTSECPETSSNCPDVQSETIVSEGASPFPSFKENVKERKTLLDILRSVRCFTTHDEENTQSKNARKLASKNKYCKRRNAEEIKKKGSSMKSDVNEIKESMEISSSVLHPALNEENSETEESYSSLISDREGELEGCHFDDLLAHQSSMDSSAAPEVDDVMNEILLGNHGDELQTSSFASYPEYAIKKQRNYHNFPCPTILYDEGNEDIKVKSENNIRSNISSTHNYNPSVQAKRSCKGDTEADRAREVDKSERRMGDHEGGNEEYVPRNVKPKRIKQHQEKLPNPVYIPTKIPSLTKKRLFMAENSMTPKKKSNESNHSTEDLMEKNSIESSPKCTISITSESSSMVEELQSPESNSSLRRSSRIKDKEYVYSQDSWSSFDSSNQDSNVSDSSSENENYSNENENEKKKKGKSLKYVKKKIETSNDLKQASIEKYMKGNSTPKKQHKKKVQLKIPGKEDSTLTNKSKKCNGSSELCKSMKKKSSASKASDQKIISKPSSSKHKAQGSKEKTDYDLIWNFNLRSEQNKKDKNKNSSNTTKQKRNISTLEKSRSVSSEKPTKEIKTKKALGRKSKSNVENYAPDGIDDEFYWRIQEETDKLSALMNDSDDVLVSRTSSDGKAGKSSGKEKQVHNKKNSRDEECCILNELGESPHSVDALRSSYKQLHNMTNNDLEQRLNDYLPYFEEVIRGTIPNERHEMYKQSSSNELRMQQDYLIYGPFTADQSLYVLDLLKEKLGHMDKLIGNTYDILSYRCRVLVPTFFTKIVMDNENVNSKEAHRLMVKFTYNRDVAEDLQSANSIKF